MCYRPKPEAMFLGGRQVCVDQDDCHLTQDFQGIITAMIAGEWDCKSCREYGVCDCGSCLGRDVACGEWQRKEEV